MESRANKRCNDVTWLERDGRRDEGISQRSRYSAGYWKVMLRAVLTLLTNLVVSPLSTISNNKVHECVFASRLRPPLFSCSDWRCTSIHFTPKNCVHYLSLFIPSALSHIVSWLSRIYIKYYMKYLHDSVFNTLFKQILKNIPKTLYEKFGTHWKHIS